MKTIQKISLFAVLIPVVLFCSCAAEFLDRKPTTALESSLVLDDPDLLPTTVVGNMSMFSGYGFWGRNAVIGGEMMTDVAVTMGTSGHLENLEKWNIFPNDADIDGFWSYCYAISAASAQTIYSAKKMLEAGTSLLDKEKKLDKDQIKTLKNAIAVSDVIKAYCDFFLAQYFCVDVNLSQADVPGKRPGTKVGIILLKDKPLGLEENANTYTLQATYSWIEKTLAEAISYFEESETKYYIGGASDARYFPTLCAAYVLQARVFLAQAPSKGDEYYQKAIDAVNNAIANPPSGTKMADLYNDATALADAYASPNANSEDIWTVNYTTQDNLSANSLQNFFNAYNCKISKEITNKFKTTDIRKQLYPTTPGDKSCCWKYPNSNGVFNVPVMRVPELYLILAECYAGMGDNDNMVENLYKVLGARDQNVDAIEKVSGAPYNYGSLSTKEAMIDAVMNERIKELCAEGFRWSDLRRNSTYGVRLNRPGPDNKGLDNEKPVYMLHFGNYNLARYALPVPYSETSTNQWIAGRGIKDDGKPDKENWQNNAWDNWSGTNYSISDPALQPEEGDGLNSNGRPL